MQVLIYIQLFFGNVSKLLVSIIRIILLSKKNKTFKNIDTKQNCIIFGNGPSLNDFIETQKDNINYKNTDIFCVNYFANTGYYSRIKPQYYVINSVELWQENSQDRVKSNSINLMNNIASKTKWKMNIFLPPIAKSHKQWQQSLGNNSNITIYYFNQTPVEGFDFFKNFCYNKNLGMPRPHNIIIPSLMIAILLNYEKIFLTGVEHSWLKDITVDFNNNVLIRHKHFYDEHTSKPRTMHKGGVGQRKLFEVLEKFMLTFKGYIEIDRFAKHKNVKIYNLTEDSYIDTFEKVKKENHNKILN